MFMLRIACPDGCFRYINPQNILYVLDDGRESKAACIVYMRDEVQCIAMESAWQLCKRIADGTN